MTDTIPSAARIAKHAINNKIITVVFPKLLERLKKQKKVFVGVFGQKMMEYLMVRYGNITKPMKYQTKAELRE